MDDNRTKSSTAVPIGSVIDDILKNRMPKSASGVTRVWKLWEKAVGEIIAENTKPAAFKDKILLVYVNSSPWLHQLYFFKDDIVRKVNAALKEDLVEDIIFKIGPIK